LQPNTIAIGLCRKVKKESENTKDISEQLTDDTEVKITINSYTSRFASKKSFTHLSDYGGSFIQF
jgi:hypothetical protein